MVMQSPFAPVKQSIFMIDDDSYMNVITVKMNPTMSASEALGLSDRSLRSITPVRHSNINLTMMNMRGKFALETRIGKSGGFLYDIGDLYQLSRVIRDGEFYGGAADQGDRGAEGTGGIGAASMGVVVAGFPGVGGAVVFYCGAAGI
jgi:hypothetical protein